MLYDITNNCASPFDIHTVAGRVALAAHGTLTGVELDAHYVAALQAGKAVTVTPLESEPAVVVGSRADLIASIEALGGKVDKRMSDARLREMLDELLER